MNECFGFAFSDNRPVPSAALPKFQSVITPHLAELMAHHMSKFITWTGSQTGASTGLLIPYAFAQITTVSFIMERIEML